MSRIYRSLATSAPSSQRDSYIYAIVPVTGHGLAAITSAGELILLDRQDLRGSPVLKLSEVPHGVNCLVSTGGDGTQLTCSGDDGSFVTFDVRSQSRAAYNKIDRAITALACNHDYIALGTEFSNQQAIVSVWDRRMNQQVWHNAENGDDVTAVNFHPSKTNVLLAGGDDGQVSLFDTTVADEDESLLQGVNHGPIHRAGFLGDNRFFALSSDQNLSIYPVSTPDDSEDPPTTILGDLRSVVPCEYVIDVFQSGDGYAVAAGSNNENPRVDIVELRHAVNVEKQPKLKTGKGYVLEGGHGEEVVRSLFADESTGTIFTAGEDGQIKAFTPTEAVEVSGHTGIPKSRKGVGGSKKKK